MNKMDVSWCGLSSGNITVCYGLHGSRVPSPIPAAPHLAHWSMKNPLIGQIPHDWWFWVPVVDDEIKWNPIVQLSIFLIFPYIENSNPNWRSYFSEGVETTNQSHVWWLHPQCFWESSPHCESPLAGFLQTIGWSHIWCVGSKPVNSC